MPEEIKRGCGRPRKTPMVETNDISPTVQLNQNYEFNSFSARTTSEYIFGMDIFGSFNPSEISDMVEMPMAHNSQLRRLSERLYSSNGLFTQCVDYCTSMPTLDNVVIPTGTSKTKKNKNKQTTDFALKKMHHKEVIRDALFKSMIYGVAFYYCEFAKQGSLLKKTMNDFDISEITELNDAETDVNLSIIPLPLDFTRIVGRKNSTYVLAFDLRYFDGLSKNELNRKLKMYPKEINDAYYKFHEDMKDSNNWVVLDNTKTIVSKVRSKMEDPWGRPLCLAAIKNILYSDYFKDTCRGTLDEINNRIIYQTFPEGRDKGSCALNKSQQENQHSTVRNAVMTKNQRNSTSFFSVAAGTKIDKIDADTSLLDEKNSSYIQDQIGVDLGFMANLLSGTGSGNFASQQNNLQLLLSEVLMWIEPLAEEISKVINENLIKDRKYPVSIYYLPCSYITRKDFTSQMKELYLQGKGSLRAWIASTGFNSDAYLELMNMELEEDFENKYPVHQTSFTQSSEDSKGGRPETTNIQNENTAISKANGANDMPSPSDKK